MCSEADLPPPSLVTGMERASRSKRHRRFRELVKRLSASPTILDVGGTSSYWEQFEFPDGVSPKILLLNMFAQPQGRFTSVVGDARDLSRFQDHAFDIVFSNSVIGHVGGFEDQLRMAKEIQRVGRHFFLQTPNHAFPVDWRTLVPLYHFLPAKAQAWGFSRMRVGRYERARNIEEAWSWATRIRNLRRAELGHLFPGATVLDERVLGLTKSFMVHNFPHPSA